MALEGQTDYPMHWILCRDQTKLISTSFHPEQNKCQENKEELGGGEGILLYFVPEYFTQNWIILLSVEKKYISSFRKINLLPVLLASSQKLLLFSSKQESLTSKFSSLSSSRELTLRILPQIILQFLVRYILQDLIFFFFFF